MSSETLGIISDAMDSLGLDYSFMQRNVADGEKPPETYFVGEYQETPSLNENGEQETTFILTGFSRSSWMKLEEAKKKIKKCFPKAEGKIAIAGSGLAVAIFYANSFPVPIEDAELKKIQINLTIKEWSVD